MILRRSFLVCSILIAVAASSPCAQAQTDAERLERLERAVEQLQKRNAELEQEVRSLKSKPAAKPSEVVAVKPSADEGKPVVQSKKEEKKEEKKSVPVFAAASEFKLTLGGFMQIQAEGGDAFAFEGRFGSAAIKDRFRIRRGRISLSGDYKEDVDFKIEGDFGFSDTALTVRDASGRTLGSNSTRTAFSATDIYANWHTYPELNVKVGQFKAPFGLEQITSDTKLFTPERTLATTALTPERQIGVQIWGRPFANLWPEEKDLLTYYAGAFNGTGRNISVNDNNEFMYVGRVEVQALRSKILNQNASLRFGANGLTSRDESGTNISSVIRENSDGSLASYNLPSRGTREGYGFDAWLHLGPFDLIGEYLHERISPRGPAPLFTAFEPSGYYVQGSYFVVPKTLQLVAKWESFDPDQAFDDDIHSISGGLNYLIKGDDIKILAHYIHTWSDFRAARTGFDQDEFDEVIVRLQVMF
jgi:phosphate-selective porin